MRRGGGMFILMLGKGEGLRSRVGSGEERG
jgi:hypothetical protein